VLWLRSLSALCVFKDVLDCAGSIPYSFYIGEIVRQNKPQLQSEPKDPVIGLRKHRPRRCFFLVSLCSWCHRQWQEVYSISNVTPDRFWDQGSREGFGIYGVYNFLDNQPGSTHNALV